MQQFKTLEEESPQIDELVGYSVCAYINST